MLIRKEIHTRTSFARKQCEHYFHKMKSVDKGGGNIASCTATSKFVQAKRIYDHYIKEFGLIMFPEIYKPINPKQETFTFEQLLWAMDESYTIGTDGKRLDKTQVLKKLREIF